MCAECEGSQICRTPLCTSYHKGPAYKYRCYPCAVRAYPHEDFPRKRQFRVKERVVVDAIKARFPAYDWSHDRRVPDGCSGLRPDLLLQMGSHVLIVEVDEHAHRTTAPQCEVARLNEISSELNFQPVAVLRFNPDAYTDLVTGQKVPSCFHVSPKVNLVTVHPKHKAAWAARLATLATSIRMCIDPTHPDYLDVLPPKEKGRAFFSFELFYDNINGMTEAQQEARRSGRTDGLKRAAQKRKAEREA